jgi:uncharacterized protein (TIGR04255 family)
LAQFGKAGIEECEFSDRVDMPTRRHLQNAPITEALIDFQVKARTAFRPEQFADLRMRLTERFPHVDEQRGLQATFGVIRGQGQPTVVQDLGLQGYLFKTLDQKTIAQFRVDGFTLNRLRPYTSWDELFPQAMDLWRLYCSISIPDAVTRLAVRYINRIMLPPGAGTFETYLRTAPVIPPELPQYLSSFLTRVTIHDPTTDIAAHVAQALETSTPGRQLSVILDIDAFKQREFSIDDPTIEQTFDQLRLFKNLIFFNSLTDETLRQFE